MKKKYLQNATIHNTTHFDFNDKTLSTFYVCRWFHLHFLLLLKRLKSARVCTFLFLFFSAYEHRNIGIIEMVIWTWFIKKHLRNTLGSYGRNKKPSAYLEKRFLNKKDVYTNFNSIGIKCYVTLFTWLTNNNLGLLKTVILHQLKFEKYEKYHHFIKFNFGGKPK